MRVLAGKCQKNDDGRSYDFAFVKIQMHFSSIIYMQSVFNPKPINAIKYNPETAKLWSEPKECFPNSAH